MRVVVIDDEKSFPFPGGWEVTYCRTFDEASLRLVALFISQEPIDQLWLDHDLGTNYTIRPLVRIMEELAVVDNKLINVKQVVICSLNSVGAEWIEDTLEPHYSITRAQEPTAIAALCGTSEGTVWYV